MINKKIVFGDREFKINVMFGCVLCFSEIVMD